MLRKGEWVWVDSSIGVLIGARVKVTHSGHQIVVDDEGNEHNLSLEQQTSLRVMHPTSVEGVDDMIRLGDLTEAGLLRNLMVRHKQGIIYTYTGSVLVAVNPYQELPIYTGDQVRLYHGRKLGELPPHVFAIADTCYHNMRRNQKSQCCIISGESGAGKTESTKLILQFLAAVSGQHSWIEQQILESNPILEAFGNAKTVHNDNSSRFGKYLEIFFNKDGVIEGACVEQYLLEKSRVCHQAQGERNYHMFYSMLAGMTAEQKKTLCLEDAAKYKFLTRGDCILCEGREDAKDYTRIRSALKILTFTETQCLEILQLLAAILHLGNVGFEATTSSNMDSSDVSTSEHFSLAAKLLEVQSASLAKSLTHRSFRTNRERVTKPLSTEQASDCRDAFVKAIYNKLFIWIVKKINSVINKTAAKRPKHAPQSIGLLDIFGFEDFETNSFEQLCINFANEQLQQFFVHHIFKLEQDEYLKEGIVWNYIGFCDNQPTLDLLAGTSCNLLALIDEESHFPKGTDMTMLNKMNQQHCRNIMYIPSKSEHDTDFGIRHFAGVVQYESEGFLEKNRDAISSDIMKMIESSTNKLLHVIFESELKINGVKSIGNSKIVMKPKGSLRGMADGHKQMPTLSAQFRQSLESLMKKLSACQPFFIRCFKPNDDKQSNTFDRALCTRQLRYSGMIDTIRVRKLGFPIQHTFKEFLQRYRVLLRTTICDPKTATTVACCEAICKVTITEGGDWKIGKTKMFLKDAHDSLLERAREDELNRKAIVIQRVMLGYHDRKCFVNKRSAAVVIQRHWRAHTMDRRFRKVRHGFERLVAKVHARQLQLQYQRKRAATITIQSQVRGHLARKSYRQSRGAVTHIMRTDIHLSLQDQEAQKQNALELQRRLEEVLAQSRLAAKAPEPISDKEMVEDMVRPFAVLGRQGPAPDGLEDLERKRATPEPVEDTNTHTPEPEPMEPIALNPVLTVDPAPAPTPALAPAQAPSPTSARALAPAQAPTSARALAPAQAPSPTSARALAPAQAPTPVSAPTPPSIPKDYEDEDEEYDDYDDGNHEFSFSKFSALHFQGNATHGHITQRLRQSLLPHEDEGDTLACLTVWWMILRFTGDIPEPKSEPASPLINNRGQKHGGRRLSHLVGLDQKILRKNKKKSGGQRRRSTIFEEVEEGEDGEDIMIGEGPTLDRPMSSLQKLHVIVGYALSRPDIRDEIYCQICKQLVNNRNKQSRQRGWSLLSICLGIFPPTDLLMKYLENFLCKGPGGYADYCTERLHRMVANGQRGEPPCWIELQASKSKKPMVVSVSLMDGQSVSLSLDSASTSAEVCQMVAKKINLKDTYGFSLYIGMYDKMWSLGSSKRHVLDAISQCEQEVRRQGEEEQHAPWRLYIRKELFAPWHDCSLDPVSTDLIYRQIIRGLKLGDYICNKEDEYVQLAAKHYRVQFGLDNRPENTRKVVEDCITMSLVESKSLAKWLQLINSAHIQEINYSDKKTADNVKGEIVDFACEKWPVDFSKFHEVMMTSGPPLPKSRFVVAINSSGIFFMDGRDTKLLVLPYIEVTGIHMTSDGTASGQLVSLDMLDGSYELKCLDGDDMAALMHLYLEGLKERSIYAITQHDASNPDPMFLACRRGDLVVVKKDADFSVESSWNRATHERTGKTGAVYTDNLRFLATLSRPPDATLKLLTVSREGSQRKVSSTPPSPKGRDEAVAPMSLREFSIENFRQPSKDGGRHGPSRGGTREKLWACSREPLKQPLLPSVARNSELNPLACNAFTAILKYMGDYPIKHARSPLELTDQIFGPATQYEALQDEIYCQIMRQMTNNNNRLSMEFGWQLMWLCTGLFPPSQNLVKHTQRFLESRPRDPLSKGCLNRLHAMLRMEPRQLPPHQVEVEAVQQNSTQIFHKVHFPNDTDDLFEVTSTTRIKDLCRGIASSLGLSSSDGYSLFMKTALKKIVSLDDRKYFFDSLRVTDQPKRAKKVKEGTATPAPYLVLFMRKLWFNVTPGRDITADLSFHFPQELPKYLRGWHNCTKEDMISLAGLLFRVKVDSDKSQFVMIPKMLRDLVPADQMKLMSPDEWKKHIISSYKQQAGITVDEAKIAFLSKIFLWPTFGCAFFDVKQTTEPSYPMALRIVISKQGVSFIDPKTKELLVMHSFNRITNWYSDATYFQITIGNLLGASTFTCETSDGHRMDDLLRSYINMYEQERKTALRPRNKMFS